MPEDIHETMWAKVAGLVASGAFAVTVEIYEELKHLSGSIGGCIKENDDALQMEIEEERKELPTSASMTYFVRKV